MSVNPLLMMFVVEIEPKSGPSGTPCCIYLAATDRFEFEIKCVRMCGRDCENLSCGTAGGPLQETLRRNYAQLVFFSVPAELEVDPRDNRFAEVEVDVMSQGKLVTLMLCIDFQSTLW